MSETSTSAVGREVPALPRSWPLGCLALAFAFTWAPTLVALHVDVWQQDPYSQGPVALALAVGLFWHTTRRSSFRAALPASAPQLQAGLAWLLPGLLLQTLGRSQGVLAFEVIALAVCAVGLTVLLMGAAIARRLWFCYVFLLFSVPLPGVLVDVLTQPMKLAVSWTAEQVLHGAGLAVARDGVVLHVGHYQLLVADACAGMHSLFTLEAFGLLYLNVVRHPCAMRHALLAISIVPVAFAANTLRVVLLAIVTLTWGDEVGRGMVHDFSGLLLFALALLLIAGLDALVRPLSTGWAARRSDAAVSLSSAERDDARAV